MVKTKEIISFVFLLLSITLIIADNCFYTSSDQIVACEYCPDLSGHLEQTHFHGADEYVTFTESKTKAIQFLRTDYLPSTHINYSIIFISDIWQPPRLV